MEIAILGTGNVGSAIGRRLASAGHRINFGSRKPAAEKVQKLVAENERAHFADSIQAAVERSSVIFLATPYGAIEETIKAAGDLSGKILIDCTNPLNQSFDGLMMGFDDSAAEQISRLAGSALVIKAFNTASVATMQNPDYDGQTATMFYCGDNNDAKAIVHRLIEDVGMEPVNSGPLKNARFLEPMAMLYIHLAVKEGWGGHCALKMLKRSS